jgi:hypothetical protein
MVKARFPQNLRVITLGDARLSPVVGAARDDRRWGTQVGRAAYEGSNANHAGAIGFDT